MFRCCLIRAFCISIACLVPVQALLAEEPPKTSLPVVDTDAGLAKEFQETRGLCVLVGIEASTIGALQAADGLLVHCLDSSEEQVTKLKSRLLELGDHRVVVEHWTSNNLPHASSLANMVVVSKAGSVHSEEVERVLCPGGISLTWHNGAFSKFVKPAREDTDEWTHQWHGPDGSLTTEEKQVGVPTGLQWLSGPLFAMAERKSSTQTLVSSGGVNFYVTQNVNENVGKPIEEMRQFLVARDAYNGLEIWKRSWDGPFVTGNGETNARMIASPDLLWAVTADDTVSSFDPKTGSLLQSLSLDCRIEKILHYNSDLLIESSTAIIAIDDRLRGEKWRFDGNNLSELTIAGEQCYMLRSGRSQDGQFKHDLIGLDLATGGERVRANTQPHVTAARVRINFAQDGLIALQAHGSLHLFNDQGDHLWSKLTEARPGKTYVDERYVGHFYRNGLIWMLSENAPQNSPLGQNVWLGLDPQTGEIERTLATQGEWPRSANPGKMGCQLLLASDRYIMIPRQSTFIDFESGDKHSFKFARGGCGLGFVSANGLMYSHPHACGCFSEALRGFMGMHSEPVSNLLESDDSRDRLTFRFRPTLNETSDETAWPIHRSGGERSAYAKSGLTNGLGEDGLQKKWQVNLGSPGGKLSRNAWALRTGNRISAATIADSSVFVADVDAGRLCALDLATGEMKWDFWAAGRIDTPPTVQDGVCLFGSHDGYVYCLNAADGQMAWKYRVAPSDRRIVAFGGVESAWPVAGTVLVKGGRVYAAAGRAPDADGGLHVMALDLLSGKPVWQQAIQGGSFWGLNDYLIDGGESVFLSNWEFDAETGKAQEASPASRHLRGGKVGLLEASWTKHDLALRKAIQTWTVGDSSGQLIAFSPKAVATFQAETHLLIIDADGHSELELASGEQVTSMALTARHLLIAGGLNRSDTDRGGFLRIIDLDSGRVSQSRTLPAEAAFDALAIAGDCVLVTTQSGDVCCYEAKE